MYEMLFKNLNFLENSTKRAYQKQIHEYYIYYVHKYKKIHVHFKLMPESIKKIWDSNTLIQGPFDSNRNDQLF